MKVRSNLAVLVLSLALGVGCANALRAVRGDVDARRVSISVDNQSSEAREIYLANARSGSIRLGRVYPLSRRVFHTPIDVLMTETILYSKPSNGALGPAEEYATTPFTLGSPREVFWVITTGRRLSAVDIR